MPKLDTRAKLISFVLLCLSVFIAHSPLAAAVLLVVCLIAGLLARLTLTDLRRALKPTALIFAFMLIANALILVGKPDFVLIGSIGFSQAGLTRALLSMLRIWTLILLMLALLSSSSSTQIAKALLFFLKPLAALGLPVTDLALIITIALRFIPESIDSFQRIANAQRLRGLDFSAGPLTERLRRWAAVLIPLVVQQFRAADALGQAMRERGYNRRRKALALAPWRWPDVALCLASAATLVIVCLV